MFLKKPILLSHTMLSSINSGRALAFLLFLPVVLNCSFVISLWSLTMLPVVMYFLFLPNFQEEFPVQPSLLPPLLDLWHNGIACSWAFKRHLLKSDHLSKTPKTSTSDSLEILLTGSLRSLPSWSPGWQPCWPFFSLHQKFWAQPTRDHCGQDSHLPSPLPQQTSGPGGLPSESARSVLGTGSYLRYALGISQPYFSWQYDIIGLCLGSWSLPEGWVWPVSRFPLTA